MGSQTYQDRNKILVSMGYTSYTAYLASSLWMGIKERVYQQKGTECYLCGASAGCVHHRGYGRDVLLGLDLSPLVPICSGCHQEVEFKANGEKRTLVEVQSRFNKIVRARKLGFQDKSKIGLRGRCTRCGAKARKGSLYCRPHDPGPSPTAKRRICPECKERSARLNNKWCSECLTEKIKVWSKGRWKGRITGQGRKR